MKCHLRERKPLFRGAEPDRFIFLIPLFKNLPLRLMLLIVRQFGSSSLPFITRQCLPQSIFPSGNSTRK